MNRLRVLKLGDEVYSQSLQRIAPVYHRAFPQRETQLYGRFRHVELTRLTHQQLLTAETTAAVAEQVRRVIDQGQFDLVLIDNPLSVLALDHRIETALVFDCIDWYEEMYRTEFGDPAGAAIIRSALAETMRRCTAIVAQSPLMLEAASELGSPALSAVIPNGYDEDLFGPPTEEQFAAARDDVESIHGVPLQGRRLVVYSGKVGEWYRGLLNLAAGISGQDVLAVVGDGPLLAKLPQRENVILTGAVPLASVPRYTMAADILAFPLGADCSPIAVSEYLAMGKPVVVPGGRIEWLIRDGLNGAVVENTPSGWRAGIARAADLGPATREANLKLARDLGWSRLAGQFEAFLHRAAGRVHQP